jgi:thiamine-monophosphate kinase
VRLDDVPVAGGATLEEALGGGEDYELLATMPVGRVAEARAELRDRFGVALSELGEIRGDRALVCVESDGSETPLAPAGWDHFGS